MKGVTSEDGRSAHNSRIKTEVALSDVVLAGWSLGKPQREIPNPRDQWIALRSQRDQTNKVKKMRYRNMSSEIHSLNNSRA